MQSAQSVLRISDAILHWRHRYAGCHSTMFIDFLENGHTAAVDCVHDLRHDDDL